jgi:hypothetical protein
MWTKGLYFYTGTAENSDGLQGWKAPVRFPAVQVSSLLQSIQTDSGAHPDSYPMGTEHDFPGGRAAGA